MNTYTWSVIDCKYIVANGFIATAVWRCQATDGEYTAKVEGLINFPESEPQVPYDEVTEVDVLGWLFDIIEQDEIESGLDEQIALQKNPVVLSGLPWNTI